MNTKELVNHLIEDSIKKAINKLGIEGTEEVIKRCYTGELKDNMLAGYKRVTGLK